MNILVSGGTGFIGSHTCVELLNSGYDVIIFDNLSNSKEEAVDKIFTITGKRPKFYKADMTVPSELEPIFEENKIDAVIHFAGLKAVGESVAKPFEYYMILSKTQITEKKVSVQELYTFDEDKKSA